jgi:hypothetical protein
VAAALAALMLPSTLGLGWRVFVGIGLAAFALILLVNPAMYLRRLLTALLVGGSAASIALEADVSASAVFGGANLTIGGPPPWYAVVAWALVTLALIAAEVVRHRTDAKT